MLDSFAGHLTDIRGGNLDLHIVHVHRHHIQQQIQDTLVDHRRSVVQVRAWVGVGYIPVQMTSFTVDYLVVQRPIENIPPMRLETNERRTKMRRARRCEICLDIYHQAGPQHSTWSGKDDNTKRNCLLYSTGLRTLDEGKSPKLLCAYPQ